MKPYWKLLKVWLPNLDALRPAIQSIQVGLVNSDQASQLSELASDVHTKIIANIVI